jgi:hypothetical protein
MSGPGEPHNEFGGNCDIDSNVCTIYLATVTFKHMFLDRWANTTFTVKSYINTFLSPYRNFSLFTNKL